MTKMLEEIHIISMLNNVAVASQTVAGIPTSDCRLRVFWTITTVQTPNLLPKCSCLHVCMVRTNVFLNHNKLRLTFISSNSMKISYIQRFV